MIFSLDDAVETAEKDIYRDNDKEIKQSDTEEYSPRISSRYASRDHYIPSFPYRLIGRYGQIIFDVLNNFPSLQITRMPFSGGLLGEWWGHNHIRVADNLYGNAKDEVIIHELQHRNNPYNPEQENRNIVKSILPFTPVFH